MDNTEEYLDAEPQARAGVGQRLRAAREAAGLEIAQVSAETRIPERHLRVIESGDFSALPARTYAVGFSRSYARVVGLDEKEIAADVREELAGSGDRSDRPRAMEPGDPARVPSRGLALASALAVILLIVGGFAFYRSYLAPGAGPGSLIAQEEAEQARQAAARQAAAQPSESPSEAVDPAAPVVFTSLGDGMWVRFYDGTEKNVLLEKLMDKGEQFTIPSEAKAPKIRTGRPDAFAVTIGGKAVPKLAEQQAVVSDVAIDAKSLLARADEPASPGQPAAAVDNPAT
ncbi:helix-turn-helix domain-containing protein [Qipengyuania oceanensis]|uniref:DUF4115 domain-containing protein n=1 Tax=Qipengyuania oceanensis TaxID=1463597 RepID=A0A844YF54_9SPHN|nr:helix-turn-helix domain-containing protein [Qipengyuania oceanensis]MXO62293.1 DUF4115 domain-containing protein [Qipengyuania oceanensis]